jgi:hypothetical protein
MRSANSPFLHLIGNSYQCCRFDHKSTSRRFGGSARQQGDQRQARHPNMHRYPSMPSAEELTQRSRQPQQQAARTAWRLAHTTPRPITLQPTRDSRARISRGPVMVGDNAAKGATTASSNSGMANATMAAMETMAAGSMGGFRRHRRTR